MFLHKFVTSLGCTCDLHLVLSCDVFLLLQTTVYILVEKVIAGKLMASSLWGQECYNCGGFVVDGELQKCSTCEFWQAD